MSAQVEHDHVAVLDDALADLVVRVCAVGPGAHDGEVHLRVTELAQQVREVGRHFGLPAPGEPDVEDALVCAVGRRRGCRQPLDLRRVLDRAEHREPAGQRDVGGLRQLTLQSQEVHGPGGV
jgi:hypothetical protein